jgi:hypothetical protein
MASSPNSLEHYLRKYCRYRVLQTTQHAAADEVLTFISITRVFDRFHGCDAVTVHFVENTIHLLDDLTEDIFKSQENYLAPLGLSHENQKALDQAFADRLLRDRQLAIDEQKKRDAADLERRLAKRRKGRGEA